MDIRREIKGYRNIAADIKRLENEIEKRKLEIIPSCTQTIDDMPKAHNIDSIVERTVLEIEKDDIIYKYQLEKARLETLKQDIDIELLRLTLEDRDYIKYYTEGVSINDLQIKYNREYQTIYNRLNEIVQKIGNSYSEFDKKYKIGNKSVRNR